MDSHCECSDNSRGEKHQGKILYVGPVQEIGVASGLTHGEGGTEKEAIGEKKEERFSLTCPDVEGVAERVHERRLSAITVCCTRKRTCALGG